MVASSLSCLQRLSEHAIRQLFHDMILTTGSIKCKNYIIVNMYCPHTFVQNMCVWHAYSQNYISNLNGRSRAQGCIYLLQIKWSFWLKYCKLAKKGIFENQYARE